MEHQSQGEKAPHLRSDPPRHKDAATGIQTTACNSETTTPPVSDASRLFQAGLLLFQDECKFVNFGIVICIWFGTFRQGKVAKVEGRRLLVRFLKQAGRRYRRSSNWLAMAELRVPRMNKLLIDQWIELMERVLLFGT